MNIWEILVPICFLAIVLLSFSNYADKQQKQKIEQRLIRMERILRVITENLDIEMEKVSDQDKGILKLIHEGKKIHAIKLTREIYGYGLKDAKDYVEELEEKMNAI